jgi:hypothetical protein
MESSAPRLETSGVFKSILVVARNTEADQTGLARAKLCARSGATVTVLDVVYEPALEGYLGNKETCEPPRRATAAVWLTAIGVSSRPARRRC